MNIKWISDIVSDKEFGFHRIINLIILLIFTLFISTAVLTPFIKEFTQSIIAILLVTIIPQLLIVTIWYHHRTNFPKGINKKHNILIAITTEDQKQKTRITKDFASEIKKQLQNYHLDESYDVIVLHNHLAKITRQRIDLFIKSKRLKAYDSDSINNFNKIAKRTKAKFFVFGDLIKRNSANSTYFLDIEALILHAGAINSMSQSLRDEFNGLWKREIKILEDDELNGFRNNANHIFFTATYMLGLATFVDNKFIHGLDIWNKLEAYTKKHSDLKNYEDKIIHLKGSSLLLLSEQYHYLGDYKKSVSYRGEYLELFPNEYAKLISKSIEHVKLRNEPELALELVNKASKLAKGDGTWRYNKMYLQIYLLQNNDALITLEEIINLEFKGEFVIINQVISYNRNCYKENLNHIQSFFIIGALLHKKLKMSIQAYEELEKFIELSEGLEDWLILNNQSKKYIKEIDNIIGIK